MPWGHTRNRGRPRTSWRDNLNCFINAGNVSPKTWTSGGQWGGPRPNNGHSTAENETELKTNTEVGSSKGYPISELTPSPKDQRSSSKIKGNGMQN